MCVRGGLVDGVGERSPDGGMRMLGGMSEKGVRESDSEHTEEGA